VREQPPGIVAHLAPDAIEGLERFDIVVEDTDGLDRLLLEASAGNDAVDR